MKDEPSTTEQAFPFLEMPAELRNRVYEIALISRNGIDLSHYWHYDEGPGFQETAAQPSLTRICHQVRQESLLVFYGANWFLTGLRPKMWLAERTEDWLQAIGHKNKSMIKHLYIENTKKVNLEILLGFEVDEKVGITVRYITVDTTFMDVFDPMGIEVEEKVLHVAFG